MAHRNGTLGHFLPYLLSRQLRVVLWPGAGEGRAATLLFIGLSALYGAGLGYLLQHHHNLPAGIMPKLLTGINAVLFGTVLLADFLPTYRTVQPPLPDPLPVSARLNAVTAFMLDLVSMRRVGLLVFLLLALLVSPSFWRPLGLSLLVWLSAAALSFNVRLLLSVGPWRHPLLGLNLLCLLAAAVWLGTGWAGEGSGLTEALRSLAVAGPLLLWVAGLGLVAPRFSARFMPERADSAPGSRWLARLSPEWKMYLRKARPALLMALGVKVFIMGMGAIMDYKFGSEHELNSIFFMVLLPVLSFTYVNNNLLGYLHQATADELERLGLTRRLLGRYLRLAGGSALIDCLVSAVLLLALYPQAKWPLLGLLPLAAGAFMALGIWGSFWKAKPIHKTVDFSTMRNNASTLVNICTIGLATLLFLLPWWARVALTLAVMLSALVPVRRIIANHGPTRRQLWQAITQEG